jgi:pimeloyl-ACP methyl ester carboxylesterase
MGGSLATLFASRYPSFIQSLTLLSPAGMMGYFPIGLLRSLPSCLHGIFRQQLTNIHEQEKIWRKEFITSKMNPEVKIIEDKMVEEQKAMLLNIYPQWIDAFIGSVLEFPMTDIRPHILQVANQQEFPIFLLWGNKDTTVPYTNKKKWLQNLQGKKCSVEFKKYENLAHVFYLENAQAVNQDIFIFISKSS